MTASLDLIAMLSGQRTFLLVCDLCGDTTRLPFEHHSLDRYLYEWKLVHEAHHVYLSPGYTDPPITDPFGAIPPPCEEWLDGEAVTDAAP